MLCGPDFARSADTGTPSAIEPLALRTETGFAVPQPRHLFEFPRDHGSHPEFKLEWWYITGHLFAQTRADELETRRFGFQATFFRLAAPPPDPDSLTAGTRSGLFRLENVYLAHMAVLDVATGRFLHQERFNRAGWNADAATNALSLRNGNWSLQMTDPVTESMLLNGAVRAEAAFTLRLRPAKPLVVFGQNNVSRKAADPTAASYYLSFSRLEVQGVLEIGTESWPVSGQAWMDHEISSSQLSDDQVGWDWASLQLNDGREIMVYRLRHRNGETDPFSTLAWIDASGRVTHHDPSVFQWLPVGLWTSPLTGAQYPFPVRLTCRDPKLGRNVVYRLEPLAPGQELGGDVGGIAYWEGACRVLDDSGAEVGSAFMELTGYAGDLSLRFR